MARSAGIISITFEALEERALKAVREGHCTPGEPVPPLYCILPGGGIESTIKEQHACLSWLDAQPSRSVVYMNFGSVGKVSANQLKETAIGLEKRGVRFLWVVRNPIAEVLNHDSVGGFATHCRWISVLESLSAGVPMLAWPLYAEQRLNMAALVEMKLPLSIKQSYDGYVSATELEERVNELMNSEKGKAIGERAMVMKEAAAEVTKDGGSSRIAIAQLVESFKLKQIQNMLNLHHKLLSK
ncbi:UDP-glucosyltransferase, putative [Ricinus communis]|uniref:UDP-glucosyltransferase, putative n=1 Tax=Ricinus communis TaxID=3988 RepID=B9RIQ9_RICCO|nr:UDP-glucosyltransferase, putative [Ricinus communis]